MPNNQDFLDIIRHFLDLNCLLYCFNQSKETTRGLVYPDILKKTPDQEYIALHELKTEVVSGVNSLLVII